MKSRRSLSFFDPSQALGVWWLSQRLRVGVFGCWLFLAGSAFGQDVETTDALIQAIKNANRVKQPVSITLAAGTTFYLEEPLPAIESQSMVTLRGRTDENGRRPVLMPLGTGDFGALVLGNGARLTVEAVVFRRFRVSAILAPAFSNDLIVKNCLFDSNDTESYGAAIQAFVRGGIFKIENSTFQANRSRQGGGAIYAFYNHKLVVDGSTFSENFSGEAGGAIASPNGPVWIDRSTFSDNSSPRGAIFVQGALDLTNSTLVGNNASLQFFDCSTLASSRLSVSNSILSGREPFCCSKGASKGHNLFRDDSCFDKSATDIRSTEVGLDDLSDNGGPTPTISLQPGSPALNSGSCDASLKDQRGVKRPQQRVGPGEEQHCDIGAYEAICRADDPGDDRLQVDIYVDFSRRDALNNYPIFNDKTCQIDRVKPQDKRIVWRIHPHDSNPTQNPHLGIGNIVFHTMMNRRSTAVEPKIFKKKSKKPLESGSSEPGKPWDAYQIGINHRYKARSQKIQCFFEGDTEPLGNNCWWYTLEWSRDGVDQDDWDPRMEEDPADPNMPWDFPEQAHGEVPGAPPGSG